jgi:hypothetical protein
MMRAEVKVEVEVDVVHDFEVRTLEAEEEECQFLFISSDHYGRALPKLPNIPWISYISKKNEDLFFLSSVD